jgi:hypothetical protein
MNSFLRTIQLLAKDYLLTDQDFRRIEILTDDVLDIDTAVETALFTDTTAANLITPSQTDILKKRGAVIVIQATGGRTPDENLQGAHFLPANMVFSVIENPEINRGTGGFGEVGLDIAETLMDVMLKFQSSEEPGAHFYASEKGIERTDLPEQGLIVWDVNLRVNGGSEDAQAFVATPVITDNGALLVTITCSLAGASIYYTTDETRPMYQGDGFSNNNGTLYTAPFLLGVEATVKARAFASDLRASLIASRDVTL